ncbi:hypothetical protein M0638_21435 [Roseomonas sp. NAR14]|uniref:Uncharacterized protein n=1 Tax=Roseomonas acroporae TaxID=2937791 RepID=A0A9X1YC08_9PROT|nr:hypothetical protein [Roseomonas acroporae]MCK8786940.1 hypothetical protein [Roseomonas acroporae]
MPRPLRLALPLCLLLSLLSQPGVAQLRTAVIPAGEAVAIAPRGAPQPVLTTRATLRSTRVLRPWRRQREEAGLRGYGYAVVPLAVAAVLAATLPGGGGGAAPSATVRTR